MKAVLVTADKSEIVVLVNESNCNDANELQTRLAAWYYVYGVGLKPTIANLLEHTRVLPTTGPVNANIYKPLEFEGDKFVDSRKLEQNGDYHSGQYVEWLEEQLGIN